MFSLVQNEQKNPPSTIQLDPVKKDASSDDRKRTVLAISLGSAIRFIGVFSMAISFIASIIPGLFSVFPIGVSVPPGLL